MVSLSFKNIGYLLSLLTTLPTDLVNFNFKLSDTNNKSTLLANFLTF